MPVEHDVPEAAGVAAGVVSDEVVEAVVSDAAAGGVDLLGPDGVLAELTKRILERALAEEMTDHLGYESGDPMGHGTGNNRNGSSPKQVLTEIGAVDLDVPRDRNATFQPRIVPKGARRLERFNSNIVALYARGLSTRDIGLELKRMYGVDVSPGLVSKVTDGIVEELTEWQNRPLDGCYPILYIDAMVVKVRTSGTVINRPAYVVMLLCLSNRVLGGEPLVVSGSEVVVVVEASFELGDTRWVGMDGCGGLSESGPWFFGVNSVDRRRWGSGVGRSTVGRPGGRCGVSGSG